MSTPAPPESQALIVEGAHPLQGEMSIHSAKNSVLFLMLAALLTEEEVVLESVPRLSDVEAMVELLRHLGASVHWQEGQKGQEDALHIHAAELRTHVAPYHLVSKMRASFVAMGALLARLGEARISMPGGCAFGPRPVDRHIQAFAELGISIDNAMGDFYAKRKHPLQGGAHFEAPTVSGTHNVILASALGEGEVTIHNAAREPEIIDIADMLNAMGANIRGAGSDTIHIEGVARLSGVRYQPIADRIEAGTFILAVAATRGRVVFHNVVAEHLQALLDELETSGVHIAWQADGSLLIDAQDRIVRPLDVVAVEYPGFPTDLQAPMCAYLATVKGRSSVQEKVFPERFTHIEQLLHCGVAMWLEEDTIHIQGKERLSGAHLHAEDIRAGGAMVIAALAAEGQSVISGVHYIQRGYARLPERLRAVGARIHLGEASTATHEGLEAQRPLSSGAR